jgi:hypothetical protein
LKDLTGGTKYLIFSITLIHGDSSLVHLEGPEGNRVYTMWSVCPFDSEDVDGINMENKMYHDVGVISKVECSASFSINTMWWQSKN